MLDCPPRFATQRTLTRKTHGGRLAVVGEALGTPFMPWQQMVADVAGEVDEKTGKLVYREIRITVPRQSGKTSLLLPVMVYRCLGAFGPRQRVVYTAQDRNKARKKFCLEHVDMLQRSPFAGMFVTNFSHGEERITWPSTGSIHGIDASGETSGHGDVLDVGVIDEAFARPDSTVENAMVPAMATRDGQLFVVSTAGTRRSKYLRSKVDDGRARVLAGQNRGIAYFEWSAGSLDNAGRPDGSGLPEYDVDDPATWSHFMPAVGRTIDHDTVAAARDSMQSEPGKFGRAYGNVWDDKTAVRQVIPAESWDACEDRTAVFASRIFWGVDVAEDGGFAAIAASGYTADGRELVEVTGDGELVDHRPGMRWVLPRLIQLAQRHGAWDVALDAAGPAASLIPALTDAGFSVRAATLTDRARACGDFLAAAVSTDDDGNPDRLAHLGQESLNIALGSADRRRIEDVWVWSRGASLTDITPLYAATLARWALTILGASWRGLSLG